LRQLDNVNLVFQFPVRTCIITLASQIHMHKTKNILYIIVINRNKKAEYKCRSFTLAFCRVRVILIFSKIAVKINK